MADQAICLRLPPEMRALAGELTAAQGVTLSEWIRMLIHNALYGAAPNFDEGYAQARALALKLSHEMITRAAQMLPSTYEEAVTYFGLAGPGRPPMG